MSICEYLWRAVDKEKLEDTGNGRDNNYYSKGLEKSEKEFKIQVRELAQDREITFAEEQGRKQE